MTNGHHHSLDHQARTIIVITINSIITTAISIIITINIIDSITTIIIIIPKLDVQYHQKGFMEDCPDGRMDREKMRVMFAAIMPKVVK